MDSPPIELPLAVMTALIGGPMYFYGLVRANIWFAGPGFLIGAVGFAMCLVDFLWWLD